MPAKKNAVTTPLHLLQQLSKSLVVHLEQACFDAQKDAEILLAQIEKQRGKTQEKLIKARAKLDDAGGAGKSKAQSKARAKLAELDDLLALLQSRQNETLSYLAELKRDAEQSLSLAKGITQVENAAAQALASRKKSASPSPSSGSSKTKASSTPAKSGQAADTPGTTPAKTTTRTRSTPAKSPASKSSGASSSVTDGAGGTTRKRVTRPASDSTNSTPAATSQAKAKPAPARKPAATRRPAAAKTTKES